MHLNVTYNLLPKQSSSNASIVMDHFGINFETAPHVIAEDLHLPIQPGNIVCFTGASGSGKSSLMRAAADKLENVLDIDSLNLGTNILIDSLNLPVNEALALLSICGLGEAQLLLRTPQELSDGQCYRFRLALALSQNPAWILADEFTATLDRTLAKVIAYNVHRTATRRGTGFLLATTHEDILPDLGPHLHVTCNLNGHIDVSNAPSNNACGITDSQRETPNACKKKRPISFHNELHLTTATKSDWPYFARWHYRSHNLGSTRYVTLLWHNGEPIGICVFSSPPLSLRQRNKYFGLTGKWTRIKFRTLNRQLVNLSRVVLHPTYRGAGLAAAFIRRSCETCSFPWIETLAQMGHINPFFEKAGFQRVGISPDKSNSRTAHSALYGNNHGKHGQEKLITKETHQKSKHAQPIYYIFNNKKEESRVESQGSRARRKRCSRRKL